MLVMPLPLFASQILTIFLSALRTVFPRDPTSRQLLVLEFAAVVISLPSNFSGRAQCKEALGGA